MAEDRKNDWIGFVCLVVVALIAFPFPPAFQMWMGVAFLLLCLSAFAEFGAGILGIFEHDANMVDSGWNDSALGATISGVQGVARRTMRFCPNETSQNGFRATIFAVLGISLVFAGITRSNSIAEQKRQEEKAIAAVIEQQRLVDVANKKVAILLEDATRTLESGDIAEGRKKLLLAISIPNATDLTAAQQLDQMITESLSAVHVEAVLMSLPEVEFNNTKKNRVLPARLMTPFEEINSQITELMNANIERVSGLRDHRKQTLASAEQRSRQYEQQRDYDEYREAIKQALVGYREMRPEAFEVNLPRNIRVRLASYRSCMDQLAGWRAKGRTFDTPQDRELFAMVMEEYAQHQSRLRELEKEGWVENRSGMFVAIDRSK